MPNFFFKSSTSGSAIQGKYNLGQVSNTSTIGSTRVVYVYHDSTNDLTNCGFFIQPYAGLGYNGQYGESFDYLNVLDWGTEVGKGLIINQTTDFNTSSDKRFFYDGVNGSGASYENFIPLETNAVVGGGGTAQGHFPAGSTAKFILKTIAPATETSPGTRNISLFLHFEE